MKFASLWPNAKPQHKGFTVTEAVKMSADVPGWMTDDERVFLASRANCLSPKDMWVEIGLHMGRSMAATVLALPHGATFVGIDVHLGSYIREDWDHCFGDVYCSLTLLRPDIRFVMLSMPAISALSYVPTGYPQVIFLDADHSYEGTSREIASWDRKLAPDGCLMGHDYIKEFPGVIQAVDEHVRDTGSRMARWGFSIWEVVRVDGK